MTPGSMLALTPETRNTVSGAGANTDPAHPFRSSSRRPLSAVDTALQRAGDGYFAWLDHVWPAAGCTHPIRLYGHLATINPATGELLATTSTADLPDGVIYTACGNRRATACPSCASTYQADAYQLIRAGLAGGKGIPASVADHPAVFATFTAPSFGPVHTRTVTRHTCADRAACWCRAEPCHARRDPDRCPHGITLACFTRHTPGDPVLGQPICVDCYDHAGQVVWNHHASELWRRTKQQIERHLNRLARTRGLPRVRIAHGKVAEYQARGAVHFHALLRLDGPGGPATPPVGLGVADLADAIRHAAATVAFTTAPHPARPSGWRIGWGEQLDVRVISARGGDTLSHERVAGYLAKYATKATEATGHLSRRLTAATVGMYANAHGSHVERLIAACWEIGAHPDHAGLRRWAHMLGYGGHFLTKARRYSTTFAALRAARILYRRAQTPGPAYAPIRTADHTEAAPEASPVVVGLLSYAGTGWRTSGDALLAQTAAALARERQRAGREDLAHEAHAHAATRELTAA